MIKTITLAIALMSSGTSLYAANAKKDTIHMFPQAEEGFVRHVIEVPKREHDDAHRVELLIGKRMLVDCNLHSFRAKIENIILKGWGFNYLKVTDIHHGSSTMMACPKPKTQKFVTVNMGEERLLRYNSRLPIVAYVPKGYEVRYRIWSAGEKVKEAVQR